MKSVAYVVLLAFVSLMGCNAAIAETLARTVTANQTSKIDGYTGWYDDCSFKPVNVDVATKPSHGSYSVRIVPGRIPDHTIFGSVNGCAGKPTKMLELYYRPAPGYHGADAMTIYVNLGGAPAAYSYEITIR